MTSVAQIIRRRRARQSRQQAKAARARLVVMLAAVLVGLTVVLPAGVTFGATAFIYGSAVRGLPAPETSIQPGAALGVTELYDRTGTTLLAAQAIAQREWVSLADLPTYVLQATLLSEDPDFLSTAGFDVFSTFSRLWQNILVGPLPPDNSLAARLVHNAVAPPPEVRTAEYAGREIALTAEIQRRYSAEQILEWHLNTNYYGYDAYGIDAAAQTYLGKRAADLTLDEAALLAAVPLATQYNPFDNETAARGRQLDLLRALRSAANITNDQFDAAAATITPVRLAGDQPQQIAPDFTAYARRQAQDILTDQGRDGAQLVARGGLKIVTTLDLDLYYQSECAARTVLARLSGQATSPDALDGQPCQTALYMPPAGAPVESAPDDAALAVIDVTTGEIRSLVGPATRLAYPPGPTLHPFVYFTGFVSAVFSPAQMVMDIPSTFPGAAEGLIYTPNNADSRFRGPINLRDAMSAWLLPPAVQVARNRGLDNVLRIAHRIGLNSLGEDGRYDLSLLERGGAVSALDVAYAYSVFAALGEMRGVPAQAVAPGYRQRNPVAVLRIEDNDGNVIWEYTPEQVALNRVGVFQSEVGYIVNDILADQSARRRMLGEVSILDLSRRAAVVNGLTGDRAADWTAGYTPQLVTTVVLDRSDDLPLTLDPLGLDGAAVIWRAVMQYTHDRDALPPIDWTRPDAIVQMPVCERSGLLPNTACPTRNELFVALPGFQPSQTDTYWQAVEINSQTGQRATTSTPLELKISSVFFIPPLEAEDWWVANNQPLPPEEYDFVSQPEFLNTAQILQPRPFDYVGGSVDIRGTLDPAGMQFYQLAYGQGQNPTEWIQIGQRQNSFTGGALLGQWDTSGLNGLYNVLLTVVRDDNRVDTATVQVTIDNTPPAIQLNAGVPGQVFTFPADQAVTLEAVVQDDYAIERVEFYHNGQLLGIDRDFPFGFSWDITQTGTELFAAVAFDAVGNQSNSSVEVAITRG